MFSHEIDETNREVNMACEVMTNRSDAVVILRCTELSAQRAWLESGIAPAAGEVLVLRMRPPSEAMLLTLFGRVEAIRREGRRVCGFSVRFINISDGEREVLSGSLSRLNDAA